MDFPAEMIKTIAEDIVLFGGAAMAIFYGIKRMYGVARNVEKLVESAEDQKRSTATAVTASAEIRKDLQDHVTMENERDAKRDNKFDLLANSVTALSNDLRAHVKVEEDRDVIRDKQLIQLTDHMDEVISEMRPNGGSSMKDIMNKTAMKVSEVHTRVSVLEEWKNMVPKPKSKSSPKKKVRRKMAAAKRK